MLSLQRSGRVRVRRMACTESMRGESMHRASRCRRSPAAGRPTAPTACPCAGTVLRRRAAGFKYTLINDCSIIIIIIIIIMQWRLTFLQCHALSSLP